MGNSSAVSGYRCYHCGSPNGRKAGLPDGKQRLRCRDCGRGYYEGPEPERVSSSVRCYHCGSMETCKAGFSRFNGREKQKYFCRSCKRLFRENLELPMGNGENRNFWIRKNLPSAGHLVLELRALAQHLGRTPKVDDVSERSKQGLGNSRNTYAAVFGTFREALRRARLTPDYPRQYSPEKMIAELRTLRKKLGRPITVSDIQKAFRKGKAPSFYFLKRAFGSVTKAIDAADAGPKVYTRAEMIVCLNRLGSTLGRRITRADVNELYRQNKGPSYDAVKRMFGSIQNAIRAAGLKKYDPVSKRIQKDPVIRYSEERLIADLKRLGEQLGRRPTRPDIQQARNEGFCAAPATYSKRIGSLREAYRRAGFTPNPRHKTGPPARRPARKWTDDELIAYIGDLIKKLGGFPGDDDFREASKGGKGPTANTITKYLGTLSEVHARFFPDTTALRPRRKWTDDELIAYIGGLTKKLGGFPGDEDVRAASRAGEGPSANTINTHLGPLSEVHARFFPDTKTVRPRSKYSDEQVKILFWRFVKDLGRFPGYRDLKAASKAGKCPSPEAVTKRLGKLSEVKKIYDRLGPQQ